MWLVYDRDALYLAARLHVKDSSSIICRNLERDSHKPEQDAVGLILDSLNDNRTAYGFIVNPSGVRTDIAIYNDAETMQPQVGNPDWNAFWHAAVEQNEKDWMVEIRISFSSLRLRTQSDGSAEVGLILWRYIARNVEYDVFPAIPNKWQFSPYKPSQALDIKLQNIRPSHPLYIRPYMLGGLSQKNLFNDILLAYRHHNSWERDAGLDLKYNLTSNLVLDITLKTDFAQVEADDQQINLTRFSLFFPEKRNFFQERSDLFSFRLPGGQQTLFHSRAIGIINETAIPILGGTRLTGGTGNWEIGLIEMQAGKAIINGSTLPSENFGVFRLKRELAPDGSYLGALFTSRTDFKGAYSFLASIDTDIRLKGYNCFRMQVAQSAEPGRDAGKSLMATVILHSMIRRGFSYGISAIHIGTQFNPGLGFLFRTGINRLGNRLGYTWFPEKSSLIQNHGFHNRRELVWNLHEGKYEDSKWWLLWGMAGWRDARPLLDVELLSHFETGIQLEPCQGVKGNL